MYYFKQLLNKNIGKEEVIGMKKVIFFGIFLFLFGCAIGPQTQQEAFPARNQDPRLGLIINEGEVHLNLYIKDEAGRLVEQIYLAGVNRHLEINGQKFSKYWVRKLEYGCYRVEVWSFYYQTNIARGLLGGQMRYRIDLPKFETGVCVNKDSSDYYDYNGARRHWGWILRLNGGNIPQTANGLPGINLNLRGEVWKLIFGE